MQGLEGCRLLCEVGPRGRDVLEETVMQIREYPSTRALGACGVWARARRASLRQAWAGVPAAVTARWASAGRTREGD